MGYISLVTCQNSSHGICLISLFAEGSSHKICFLITCRKQQSCNLFFSLLVENSSHGIGFLHYLQKRAVMQSVYFISCKKQQLWNMFILVLEKKHQLRNLFLSLLAENRSHVICFSHYLQKAAVIKYVSLIPCKKTVSHNLFFLVTCGNQHLWNLFI